MARYRVYPTKNTTILEKSPTTNTGENEVTELWYGVDGISRYLVRFNTEEYVAKYNQGMLPSITETTATLVLNNCYPTLESSDYLSSVQASSVDLVAKLVQQDWDEGNGHNLVGYDKEAGYANWMSATTDNAWALSGGDYLYTVFSGHIDKGYEPFSGDVTDEIELWNAFTGNDFGISVMYSSSTEALSTSPRNVLKFYTRNTNTYYSPYIQFDWDNRVTDERDEVYSGVEKKLYLYVKNHGSFSNVYSANSVVVTYEQNGGTSGWTATTINNPMRGIYYVDYQTPGIASANTMFTDVWNVTYEDGTAAENITQTGTIKTAGSVWSTGSTHVINTDNYYISVPEINSEYEQGSNLYLKIENVVKYTAEVDVIKDMEYTIYLKDGMNKIEMVPWEGVSYSPDTNFIMLDTQWFLSGFTYGIDFRYTVGGTLVYADAERKFSII